MARSVERELKWRLSHEQYTSLAGLLPDLLGPGQVLRQENRFYDTPCGRLAGQLMLLRLRRENGRVIKTLKQLLVAQSGGLHQHDEDEDEVPLSCWNLPAAELPQHIPLQDEVLEILADAQLCLIGSFSNHRIAFEADGEHIALDRTCFPGAQVDWELEVETEDPPASRGRWHRRFELIGGPMIEQQTGKYLRYRSLQSTRGADPG